MIEFEYIKSFKELNKKHSMGSHTLDAAINVQHMLEMVSEPNATRIEIQVNGKKGYRSFQISESEFEDVYQILIRELKRLDYKLEAILKKEEEDNGKH